MSERKINLEEIWSKYEKFSKAPNLPGVIDLGYFKTTVNAMMLEFGKQLLELAAENAKAEIHTEWEGNTGSEYYTDYAVVNKQSILDTINLVH